MSNSALRKSSQTLRLLAAALAVTSAPAIAQEALSPPWGVYGGVAGGFAPSQRQCHGASREACERLTFGSKIFAGYQLTPGLAAEINYFYFNGIETGYTTAYSADIGKVRESGRAYTLGINWSVELLHSITNHIKVGLARSSKMQTFSPRSGSEYSTKDIKTVPYLGAGLSYSLTNNLKFDSGFDYLIDGHDSRYLFSLGLSVEY